jgi:hypothetical protein
MSMRGAKAELAGQYAPVRPADTGDFNMKFGIEFAFRSERSIAGMASEIGTECTHVRVKNAARRPLTISYSITKSVGNCGPVRNPY